MRRTTSVLLLSLLVASPLSAQDKGASSSHDIAVALRFGTLGLGLEVGKLLIGHISARIGANYFSASTTKTKSDLSYDVKLKMQAVSLLVDLYPSARGKLHLTLGLMTDPLKINGTGIPSGSGTYDTNHHPYTAAQVGTLTAEGKFLSVGPYVGLGLGSPASKNGGFVFFFDLGTVIGKPTFTLAATGAANNPVLAADLEAERAKDQKDVQKYAKVYPVLDLGLGWRF